MTRPSLFWEKKDKLRWYIQGGHEKVGDIVPSRCGAAVYLGVARHTLQNWQDSIDEAKEMMDQLAARQERDLINGGLGNQYSAVVTKLMLANHGYGDKVQQDNTNSDGSLRPVDNSQAIVDAINRKYQNDG